MMRDQEHKPKAIRIDNVRAAYGSAQILSDIALDVERGETFGLIGLNGAGKTTLIKIMLGLLQPVSGTVDIFGQAAGRNRGSLAYLPEKFEPPAFLSGLEFIRFSLDLYGRAFDLESVLQAADRVGLDRAALSRRVNTYSKGMRQKTGLMATWLTDCPLLILDEPMSGLDPRARAQVKDEIIACRKRGVTVFLSSHILADMDEICDRVAVVDQGRLLFIGTPADLKTQTGQAYLERAFLQTIDGQKAA